MKNETLYWTIGGVGLALLALFAINRGGSTTTSSGGGGVDASSLTSMTNTVNNAAAAVEERRIQALSDYAIHSSSDAVAVFAKSSDTAAAELATVEDARTTRMANDENFRLGEFSANLNHLDVQAAIGSNERISGQQTAAQIERDKIAADTAHVLSDNATTMARINKGSSFGNFMQSLVGSVTQLFSGGLSFGGSKPAAGASAPPPASSMGGMGMGG